MLIEEDRTLFQLIEKDCRLTPEKRSIQRCYKQGGVGLMRKEETLHRLAVSL